jgi:hypothetical protein
VDNENKGSETFAANAPAIGENEAGEPGKANLHFKGSPQLNYP